MCTKAITHPYNKRPYLKIIIIQFYESNVVGSSKHRTTAVFAEWTKNIFCTFLI